MVMTTGGPPPPGISWQALIFDSFTLATDTEIRMKNIPDAQFNLSVQPSIQMRPPSKFRLRVAPMIDMAGGNNEFAQFGIGVAPRIRWIPSAAFKASVTPTIAMGGKPKSTGLFGVNLTPHLGMTGSRLLAVSYDATGAGAAGTGTANTQSWAHTIAGNCVVMGLTCQVNQSTLPTLTAKVGTTAMTRLDSSSYYVTTGGFYIWTLLFGLLNPPTGAQTVSIAAASATEFWAANSVSYNNVGSFGSVVSAHGGATAPAISASSAARQMVFSVIGGWENNFTSGNQTSRWNSPLNAGASGVKPTFIQDAPGAATVNVTASPAQTTGWGALTVPLVPAA